MVCSRKSNHLKIIPFSQHSLAISTKFNTATCPSWTFTCNYYVRYFVGD